MEKTERNFKARLPFSIVNVTLQSMYADKKLLILSSPKIIEILIYFIVMLMLKEILLHIDHCIGSI